ncbi:MAG: hypothetical protein COA50_10245 [Flavobacteriaceae bacterium]|nr:MAG: hypothetical protein COA50_10245 [Flavobacteriaceae bacterium]
MKIKKIYKRIGFYLLGLITIPIILFVFNFFEDEPNLFISSKKQIQSEWVETLSENGFNPKLIDSGEFNSYVFPLATDSMSLFMKSDISVWGKVVAYDFSLSPEIKGESYQSIISSSLGNVENYDSIQIQEYLEYIKAFVPRAKCDPIEEGEKKNKYKLFVELKGKNLYFDKFEFNNLNYTNPRCFDTEEDKFNLANWIDLPEGVTEIPYRVYFTATRRNTAYEYKLLIKDLNDSIIGQMPKEKDKYIKGQLRLLSHEVDTIGVLKLKIR